MALLYLYVYMCVCLLSTLSHVSLCVQSGQKGTSDSQRVPDEGKDPIESVKVKTTPTPDGIEEGEVDLSMNSQRFTPVILFLVGKSPSRVILSIAPTPTKESQDNDSYSSSEEYFAPAVSTKVCVVHKYTQHSSCGCICEYSKACL